jgi:hypothetical protein
MANAKQISKLADQYYGIVKSAQARQTQKIVGEMIGLVRGAIVSMQHLLSLPKYKDHSNFNDMLQLFKGTYQVLMTMSQNQNEDLSSYLVTLENDLGSLSFFTSQGNVGTGRDALTDLRIGGYTDPAYYVNHLFSLFDALKKSFYEKSKM